MRKFSHDFLPVSGGLSGGLFGVHSAIYAAGVTGLERIAAVATATSSARISDSPIKKQRAPLAAIRAKSAG
jgi:hypothetical protein